MRFVTSSLKSASINDYEPVMNARGIEAVVVGGSAGALEVIVSILRELPAEFPLPVVIVLHVLPDKPSHLTQVLSDRTPLAVKEAEDKEPLRPATVYVAPPNYHLLIERKRCFSLSMDEPVYFSRPAIDVLFETAAVAYGPALAGVLLSGASEDGAHGLAAIHSAGGVAAVQLPSSASSPTMPEAGLRQVPEAHVLRSHEIGAFLVDLVSRGVIAEAE